MTAWSAWVSTARFTSQGLTLTQAKVKILQHLRRYLNDELLGLYEVQVEEEEEKPREINPPNPFDAKPEVPNARDPFHLDPDEKPKAAASKAAALLPGSKVRSIRQGNGVHSYYGRSRHGARIRLLARIQEPEAKKTEEPRQAVKVPIEVGGQVTITIEAQPGEKKTKPPAEIEPGPRGQEAPFPSGRVKHPQDSDRIFLDVTAHNSKNYYIEGDVGVPGHLPFTGHETVLDALDLASGLLPTAEPKDIRLVRPGRGGKPRQSLQG